MFSPHAKQRHGCATRDRTADNITLDHVERIAI
jgi:hypothetical protein